tara:strand:- start:329 stop:964 length:636 start_codon:yes stop_codon:yes gene_type:complete
MQRNRREFLEHVGSGMLIAGLGSSLAGDLGVSTAFADEADDLLDFGELQPLVSLLQETPANKIQPILVKKLKEETTDLRQLIAAAALANAETFGGEDNADVHRFVLAHRAFGLVGIIGQEHAHTMLRQCVRYCVKSETNRIKRNRPQPPNRRLVPRLLDEHKLLSKKPGKRNPGDEWLENMSMFIHSNSKDRSRRCHGDSPGVHSSDSTNA